MSSRRSLSFLITILMSGVGGSVLAVSDSRAQEARAAYAYVTANLNQRAGPSTRFPALQVIPARTQITVNGCLSDLSWCEGSYGDIRGWMSANYLRLYDYNQRAWVEVGDYARSTRLARYTFDLERYWAAHYRDRPFYAQRAAWVVAPRSQGVDTGVFYRELSPYGRWTALEGRYVWMPNVGPGWRPYTEGRWEYTQRYGWTWVSYEPFGWATYHYGRWAYSHRLGWVWVPGTQWAPAWVAWRGDEDNLAWAPLPPDAGPDFQISISFDAIPSYYWQVVPSAYFLRPNLAEVVVRDDRDRRAWLERTRPIGNVTVVNNTVVNNVINVNYVEQKTRERVVPREVVITNDERRQAQATESVVHIYQPPVTEAPVAQTPPAVLPAEVAAGQSQTVGQAGDEPATEDRVAEMDEPEAAAPPTEAPPLAEDEAPATDAPAAEAPADVPAEDVTEPPAEEPPPPPAAEEPPPPPPAAEEPAPPPAAEEPAPPPAAPEEPPPPPAAPEEPPPPPAAAEEPAPPPAAEEPAPPPAAEEPPPPAAAEEPAPPPAAAEEPPPPPAAAEEPAPPPAAAEEPPPPPPAAEEPAPPPAAAEEPPPPPAAEEPPPPPPAAEEPPPPPAAAEEPPPPPPAAEEPPPPPPAAEEAPAVEEPEASPGRQDCGEGMRLNRQGECVPRRNQQGD